MKRHTNLIESLLFSNVREVQTDAIFIGVGDASFDLGICNDSSFNYAEVRAIDRVQNFVRGHQCWA